MKSAELLVLVTVLCFFTACTELEILRREEQIKTHSALANAGHEITRRAHATPLTRTLIDEVLMKHLPNGHDFWGNPIRILTREAPAGAVSSYVLVSFGADAEADYATDEYFTVQRKDVAGDLNADIIIRDGQTISAAGK